MKTRLLFLAVCMCTIFSAGATPLQPNSSSEANYHEGHWGRKNAEKKPAIFYQRLLNTFCQRYYHEAFNRKYHTNSIIVDKVDVVQGNWKDDVIVSWQMFVIGRHSFQGFMRNHNDSPFTAFVDDLGDNTYKITFYIRRYDPFGDQMKDEECATRIITYTE